MDGGGRVGEGSAGIEGTTEGRRPRPRPRSGRVRDAMLVGIGAIATLLAVAVLRLASDVEGTSASVHAPTTSLAPTTSVLDGRDAATANAALDLTSGLDTVIGERHDRGAVIVAGIRSDLATPYIVVLGASANGTVQFVATIDTLSFFVSDAPHPCLVDDSQTSPLDRAWLIFTCRTGGTNGASVVVALTIGRDGTPRIGLAIHCGVTGMSVGDSGRRIVLSSSPLRSGPLDPSTPESEDIALVVDDNGFLLPDSYEDETSMRDLCTAAPVQWLGALH
jgi:hypothetical protein